MAPTPARGTTCGEMALVMPDLGPAGDEEESDVAHLRQDDYDDEGTSSFQGRTRLTAIGSRPGAELSLYIEQTAPFKWEPCGPLTYGAKRVSRIFYLCYMRELWAPPSEIERRANQIDKASGAALRYADRETMSYLMDGLRRNKVMSDILAIENFALKYHPQNPWAQWVLWCGETATKIATTKNGTTRDALIAEACARKNEPLLPGIFLSLLQSVQREAGVERDYDGVSIPGQGAGYPTVYQYVTASAFFHKCLRLRTLEPSTDQRVLDILAELRDNHLTEHVSVLDVYYDLPYIRNVVFSDPELDDGEKLMWWALILVMLEQREKVLLTEVKGGDCHVAPKNPHP